MKTVRPCLVHMCVVAKPAGHEALLHGMGFRPAKSGNWYRFYDLRLPGLVARRLDAEALLARHGIQFEMKPVRSSAPRKASSSSTPSAAAWLRQHDRPTKLDRLRQVRKQSRAKRVARQATAT